MKRREAKGISLGPSGPEEYNDMSSSSEVIIHETFFTSVNFMPKKQFFWSSLREGRAAYHSMADSEENHVVPPSWSYEMILRRYEENKISIFSKQTIFR